MCNNSSKFSFYDRLEGLMVNYGGVEYISCCDWPGVPCGVIFLAGCNLDCSYCQNRHLLSEINFVPYQEVAKQIEFMAQMKLVDGVVFSGGECYLQPIALKALLRKAKDLGLKTATESNGTAVEAIIAIAEEELVDHFFFDIKYTPSGQRFMCYDQLLTYFSRENWPGKVTLRIPTFRGEPEAKKLTSFIEYWGKYYQDIQVIPCREVDQPAFKKDYFYINTNRECPIGKELIGDLKWSI